MLEKLGHTFSEAETGLEALSAMEVERFDIILMDLQMPDMDGIEATKEIRKRWVEADERPRIIAVTASAKPEDRQRCLEAGMDDFLTKPLKLATLKEALEMAESDVNTAPVSSQDLIDPEQFEMITDIDDEHSVETFWLFCDDFRSALVRLSQFVGENDPKQFQLLAYEQKSNSGTFGLPKLQAAMARLEKKSLSGFDNFQAGWHEDLVRLLDESIAVTGVPPRKEG